MKKILCLLFTASALSVFGETSFSYRLHNGDINKTDTVYVESKYEIPVVSSDSSHKNTHSSEYETYSDTVYIYNTNSVCLSADTSNNNLGLNGLGWYEINIKDKKGNASWHGKEYQPFEDWDGMSGCQFTELFPLDSGVFFDDNMMIMYIKPEYFGYIPFIKKSYKSVKPGKYPVYKNHRNKINRPGKLEINMENFIPANNYKITKIEKIGELKTNNNFNAYEGKIETKGVNWGCQAFEIDKNIKPSSYTQYIYAIDGFVNLKGTYKDTKVSGTLKFRLITLAEL